MLINMMYNRDCQCHSHTNFLGNGLPIKIQKEIARQALGRRARWMQYNNYHPHEPDKARFAVWSVSAQGAARFPDPVQLDVPAGGLAAEGARLRRGRRRRGEALLRW